nr:hypothetical protein [Micromonospora acroterricola]
MQLDPGGGTTFSAFDRRTAMTSVGVGMMSWVLPERSKSHGSVETVLPAFRSWLDDFRRLGQCVDPSMIIQMSVVATNTLRALISDSPGSPERSAALRLASRFAEYTGWMAQEKGDDDASAWWTNRAVEMAASGGDKDLAAYALLRRADLTLYRDDWVATLSLAQDAQARSGLARVRAHAAQREAQAHALAGDERASRRCLDRSATLMAQSVTEDVDGPVLGSTTMTDPVAFATGWCLFDLGHPRDAAEILSAELTRLPASAMRTRARYGARLALAHAQAGDIDQACAVADPVVSDMRLLDSATVRYDLRHLSRILRRWRSQPAVRELMPSLARALQVVRH